MKRLLALGLGLLLTLNMAMAGETTLKATTLMPLWTPQAQFAGFYVAADRGIYQQHGIDLKILMAGPGHSPVEALAQGQADFAVLWLTTALRQRAAGLKLVNLAQIIQRSSIMLIAKKSSGINSIADMNGKKVGLWGGELSIPPNALFARHQIKVIEVPQSHSVNLFLRGGIDVTSAMWFNEYHTLYISGLDPEELNVVALSEQDLNFPEDGIYTLASTLQRDPERVKAFVEASLEGWRYAFEHPEEALDIVIRQMRAAHLPANRVHQRWMLQRMQDLMTNKTSAQILWQLNPADYQAVAGNLQNSGLIADYPDFKRFTGNTIDAENP